MARIPTGPLHSWVASSQARSLLTPAGENGPVIPPTLGREGAQETSASCPHPALGSSCFPLLCSPTAFKKDLSLLRPLFSRLRSSSQTSAFSNPELPPGAGALHHGCDPPRGQGQTSAGPHPAQRLRERTSPRRTSPSPGPAPPTPKSYHPNPRLQQPAERPKPPLRGVPARAMPGWPRAPGRAAGSNA